MLEVPSLLEQFDQIHNDINMLLMFGNMDNSKKAKTVARIISLLENSEQSREQKKILSFYKVRQTREVEEQRKTKYVGKFDFSTSEE